MSNIEMRNRFGCLDIERNRVGCDNLAIALASYFDKHVDRPEDDPIDSEVGWGVWVMAKSNEALDIIAEQAKSEIGAR
jgi:hypothetical protein